MVGEDRYCLGILTQISAVTHALREVAVGLLDDSYDTVSTMASEPKTPKAKPSSTNSPSSCAARYGCDHLRDPRDVEFHGRVWAHCKLSDGLVQDNQAEATATVPPTGHVPPSSPCSLHSPCWPTRKRRPSAPC
ncbi:metal-sensing transcriptional repressor [Streptomyces sp. NPDC015245]